VKQLWTKWEPIFTVENHGLGFGGIDFHPDFNFTVSCKQLSCMLKIMAWKNQKNYIIWKRQSCNSEVPKPDTILFPIMPWESVHKNQKTGSMWQPCWSPTCTEDKLVFVPKMQTALALIMQGPNCPQNNSLSFVDLHALKRHVTEDTKMGKSSPKSCLFKGGHASCIKMILTVLLPPQYG